jgi:colicin import membrane protein
MTVQQQPQQPATPDLPAAPGVGRHSPRRPDRPHLSGDLPTMLDSGPAFATAWRGYDRLQVDNYVAWAESELHAAQRITDELVTRLAASEADLQRARQLLELLAQSERDRNLLRLSDRVADLLCLAEQEAAASAAATAADAAQADDIIAHAREEAEVIVRRARQLEAHAAARVQAAERRHAETQVAEEQTRNRVRAMLQEAADERDRLEAAAATGLTQAEQQLHELQHRQHRARQFLRRLNCGVDAALATLSDEPPTEFSFRANRPGAPPDACIPDPPPANLPTLLTESPPSGPT